MPSRAHYPPEPQSASARVLAWHAYCSNLHARLISAFDAIDAIKHDHSQELDRLQSRMHILHARYRMLKQRVKSAEKERDDLRDNVDKLIQKVERANDYRVLPHATVHMSSSLDPLEIRVSQGPPEPVHPPDSHNPLVFMLVRELAFYKYNHMQLKRSSDAQVALLEAQLARRDFELETYQPCTCPASHAHYGSQPRHNPNQFGAQTTSPSILADKHAFKDTPFTLNPPPFSSQSWEETAHRQRILQTEIVLLREKLDNEKRFLSEGFPTAEPNNPPPTSTKEQRIPSPNGSEPAGFSFHTDAMDLQAERDNIANSLTPTHDGRDDDQRLKQSLLLEEECIRLRRSEQELRQKLLLASTTEQVLRDSINTLQERLLDSRNVTADMPAIARMNRVQAELKQVRAETDTRQLAIEQVRDQIVLLQNIKDAG